MMVRDVVRDCLEKDAAERTENDIGKLKCSVVSGQRNTYQGFVFLVSIRHTVEKSNEIHILWNLALNH
jgi:hypothetical protein